MKATKRQKQAVAAMNAARKTEGAMTREEKLARARERRDAKKVNECVCGCGVLVAGKFAQGHDQRVRGMLLKAAKGEAKLPNVLVNAMKNGLVIHAKDLVKANQPVLTEVAA